MKAATALAAGLFLLLATRESEAQYLTNHGGRIVQHPRVYVSYWNWPNGNPDPGDVRGSVEGLLSHIGKTKYMGLLTQYTGVNNDMPTPQDAGWGLQVYSDLTPWPTDTPVDRHPNREDVEAAVRRAANVFGASGPDDIIFIVTGPNRTYWLMPPEKPTDCVGGYHRATVEAPTAQRHIYADVPYPGDTQSPPRWATPTGQCGALSTGEVSVSGAASKVAYPVAPRRRTGTAASVKR